MRMTESQPGYMTASEYQNYSNKKKRVNKYRNEPVIINNEKFDSKKEYYRYIDLQFMKAKGEVIKIERQKSYRIIDGVKGLFRAKFYIADFVVTYADGHVEVEDVKSEITRLNRVYVLKKHLMYVVNNILIKEL